MTLYKSVAQADGTCKQVAMSASEEAEIQSEWQGNSPSSKGALLDISADARWEKENGGITFGGATVSTDDRSKLLIFAARTKAKEDSTYSKSWKIAPSQYVVLDAASLIALGDAVEQHVSACFAKEEDVSSQIDGGSITAASDVFAAYSSISTSY